MPTQIQHRRGTASAWAAANPVLAAGVLGYETDTGKVKFGDGTTTWNSRPYFASAWDDIIGRPAVATGMVASTLVQRDSNLNFSAGEPSAAAHVATKGYVDNGAMRASPGMQFRYIGCVIRFSDVTGKFEFISDTGHYPSGVSSIETYSDRIVVNYSFTANQVITAATVPDETLARQGYNMGPSVGTSSMTIYVGQAGATDYVTTNGTTLTSLTGFVNSFTRSTTAWSFTHDTMDGPVGGVVNYRVPAGGTLYHAHADSLGVAATGVKLYNTAGTIINPSTASGTFGFWIMRGGTRRVNPLTELNIRNSNIWISALMSV
ncbi:minor tail protein [Arthrobacter phage Shambre1]|uniref:Minor tail protein n=1 Tax=Arthrobacter phage Shambre1 TaxID=2927284 RepID=A0A977KQ06_9CAUD|nr:minor tail protein [Arthrobacter phage Shambre1]UXE04786.1 minor tail protein [Arthrobacter phage Shambre1]